VVDHLTEGFAFAVRIFAPVIPIFAFFLLGDAQNASHILGSDAPGLMLDIGSLVGRNIAGEPVLLCLGILAVAAICGIDGSGFAGLPLVGALSGAVAAGSPHNVAVLSAVGQVASIWVGGGTVVPWSGVLRRGRSCWRVARTAGAAQSRAGRAGAADHDRCRHADVSMKGRA
jgi:hypothetical protein